MNLIQNISHALQFLVRARQVHFGRLNIGVAVQFTDGVDIDAFVPELIAEESPIGVWSCYWDARSYREPAAQFIQSIAIPIAL